MLRDPSFRTVLTFTAVYAAIAVALLVMQPTDGRTTTAVAGGNFEAPVSGIAGYFAQLAAAE